MTDLHTLLRLLPSSVLETLSPEQRSQLLKALLGEECLQPNGPKTEPLKGPDDLLALFSTITGPTEPPCGEGFDENDHDDDYE